MSKHVTFCKSCNVDTLSCNCVCLVHNCHPSDCVVKDNCLIDMGLDKGWDYDVEIGGVVTIDIEKLPPLLDSKNGTSDKVRILAKAFGVKEKGNNK